MADDGIEAQITAACEMISRAAANIPGFPEMQMPAGVTAMATAPWFSPTSERVEVTYATALPANRRQRELDTWPEWPATIPPALRRSHHCDERCTCPVDGKPMLYWPAGGEHACQGPECRYAHGDVDD